MRCLLHRTEMTVLGCCVSNDETQILTTWWCEKCGRRALQRQPNYRYVPLIPPEQKRENKGAKTKRTEVSEAQV